MCDHGDFGEVHRNPNAAMKCLGMDTDDNTNINEQLVSLKVYIPDLLIQKNYQFRKDELICFINQNIIASLPKELKESFNYGIFCPPVNGKAGKFLDEQRPLGDYPFRNSAGYVELRYKRRVYKMLNIEEKQIKQMHTRSNLRRMLDHVANGQIEKITKMCSRGMDPNFHCTESGETPLTLSTSLKQPARVILALINGGALLDFRTKDGLTALHKAVERNNLEALKTLLDLGASPNYKDNKGLTPLYYTLLHSSDHQLTEVLLHDHAFIGTCDPQGWQEVHQACKHGLVQHLENLLFYGANTNAKNASGNTPLHVCAVNDQESCARVLLFRGADKNALNYANQNPYQVAIIAGNLNLGELIRNHNEEDIVPYREMPQYNPRRRASIAPTPTLCRTISDPRLDLSFGMKPPSPCPSNCSLPPFSSVSCISDTSTSSSTCTQPSGEESADTTSGSIITEKSAISDSSGVCTSSSATSYDSGPEFNLYHSGSIRLLVSDYSSSIPGHLKLHSGDIVEVVGEYDNGLLLGKLDTGQVGLLPQTCIQEGFGVDTLRPTDCQRVEGRRENSSKHASIPKLWKSFGEPRTVILHKGKKGFGFVLRGTKASSPLMERELNISWPSQYLEDVNKGGVADLSGLKKGDYLLEINGQDVSQASHEHVVSIIQQSGNLVAMTVLTMQNFPFAAEVENLPLQYHQFATLPRKFIGKKAPTPPKRDPKTTLSVGRVKAHSMVAGLAEIEYLDRSLKEHNSEGRSTKSSSAESISNKIAIINNSDPHLTKTASIKARPSSQRVSAAELEQFFARQGSKRQIQSYPSKNSSVINRPPKVYGSVAEMKRSKASRLKPSEVNVKVHKEFFSTPDLKDINDVEISSDYKKTDSRKRSISQEELCNIQKNRHSWACSPSSYNSYPGLCENIEYSLNYNEAWKSIEDAYDSSDSADLKAYSQTLPLNHRDKSLRASCPPPSHPPPPPPLGSIVKVDISKVLTEFLSDINTEEEADSAVMSSFRPGDSAKLYASPEVVMSVGYKDDSFTDIEENITPKNTSGGSANHSKTLQPKLALNKSDKRSAISSDVENSGDSGRLYSTFKKTNRQRDSMSTDSGHASDRGTLKLVKGKPTVTSVYHPKFEYSDSDTESPRNSVITSNNEPFIPEPDYESSEDEYIPTSVDKAGSLSTFGKTELFGENSIESVGNCDEIDRTEFSGPNSPHTEAKKAIQEARERLRFSQKPLDKNATVVFISGKITERKIEKSEIQLHRTEEGRLTGTVVISTTNENQDPAYLSSSILKTYDNDQSGVPRYPSRDAPASEYAKYRQQILNGVNQSSNTAQGIVPTPEELQNAVLKNIKVLKTDSSKNFDNTDRDHTHLKDCYKEVLANANSCTSITKEGLHMKSHPEVSLLQPKEICTDDLTENSSSGVSSDIETQSDQVCVFSSSTEDDSKAETVIHLFEPSSESTLPENKSSNLNESKLDSILAFDSRKKQLPMNCKLARDSSSAYSHKRELPITFPQKKESLVTIPLIRELPITCPQIRESPITYSQGESKVKSTREKELFVSAETQTVKPSSSKHRSSWDKMLQNDYSTTPKSVQIKDRRHHSPLTKIRHVPHTDKTKSSTERSLEESLEVLRLQVSSLGLGAVNEVDVFTELVPPPPQFAASVDASLKKETFQSSELAIAPPPEFSDYSPRVRNRSSHRPQSNVHQRKNYTQSYHLNPSSNTIDLNLLATLRGKSPNIMQIGHVDRKSYLGSNNRGANVHLPCSSTHRHFPSGYEHSNLYETSRNELSSQLKSVQKEFRAKDLKRWNSNDISDWLDSLFLPEYKQRFYEAGITGAKLANMDSNDLMGLGVKQMGHRLNMETSLKRYLK